MPLAGLVSFISSKLGHRVSRLVQKLVVAPPADGQPVPPPPTDNGVCSHHLVPHAWEGIGLSIGQDIKLARVLLIMITLLM